MAKKKKKNKVKAKKIIQGDGIKNNLKKPFLENEIEVNTIDDYKNKQVSAGVELEDIGGNLNEPFDPSLVRIETKKFNTIVLMDRIKDNVIDLQPGFQRKSNIWKPEVQSRLIESILIRIPIPVFYMDTRNEDKWVIVDGLQRLTALKRYILDQNLKLNGLEFLTELEGKIFDDLPPKYQRRIKEAELTFYNIEKDSPKELTFNIFKRINTGGLPLSTQEIRHALNQGKATEVLEALSISKEFLDATNKSISGMRMADRECILRFFAFTITPPRQYIKNDFDTFLNNTMEYLNQIPSEEMEKLIIQFKISMRIAYRTFDNDAFRKRYDENADRFPISKALFESWSVNLNKLNNEDPEFFLKIMNKKEMLKKRFIKLMNEDRVFEKAITQGTGERNKVRIRFDCIESILREVIYD